MSRKITLEQVVASIKNPKVQVSNLTTVGGKSRIDVTCSEHGTYNTAVAEFLKSPLSCKKCSQQAAGKLRRPSFEDVVARANEIHKGKYTYSHVDYSGRSAMLHYTCPEHGQIVQLLSGHLGGKECYSCGRKGADLARRFSLDEVRKKGIQIHGDRYEYLSLAWPVKGKTGEITLVCRVHGEFKQSISSHLHQKSGCAKCTKPEAAAKRRQPFSDIVNKANTIHNHKYSYENVVYAKGEKTRIEVNCPIHGKFSQLFNDHFDGHGCPSCSSRISKQNREISEFLTSLNIEHEMEFSFPNTRKTFDIAIHTHKLVIEYNSTYWHSSEYIPSSQHRDKSDMAATNGYRCIHIFGDVWENRRPQIENLLKSALNLQTERVFARKCKVVKVDTPQAKVFLNENHVQGYGTAVEAYGLEHEGRLVAVMGFTFNTSNRNQGKFEEHAELARYATSVQVVGGFTKLLKAWLKDNPKVKTVVSFSDKSMFTGRTYEAAGFTRDAELPPDYKYREYGNQENLYHKSNYQKSKLRKRFGDAACEGKTEREITESQQIFRVYDCGKTRWLLEVKRD